MTHLSQHWRQNWCMQVMWTGSSASRKMHMQMLHSTSAEGLLAWEGLGRGLARLSCTCGFSLKSDPGGVTPHLWQHATGSSIQASSKVSLDHSAERYTLSAWNCTLGITQHFCRDFTLNQCTLVTTFLNSTLPPSGSVTPENSPFPKPAMDSSFLLKQTFQAWKKRHLSLPLLFPKTVQFHEPCH